LRINANARLRQAAGALLIELLPSIQQMIKEQKISVPPSTLNKIQLVLHALADTASPGLKAALNKLGSDIQVMQ
jgi:hypothetical protein